jgi:hypothetical protein
MGVASVMRESLRVQPTSSFQPPLYPVPTSLCRTRALRTGTLEIEARDRGSAPTIIIAVRAVPEAEAEAAKKAETLCPHAAAPACAEPGGGAGSRRGVIALTSLAAVLGSIGLALAVVALPGAPTDEPFPRVAPARSASVTPPASAPAAMAAFASSVESPTTMPLPEKAVALEPEPRIAPPVRPAPAIAAPRPPLRSPRVTADCKTPYIVDPDGIHIPKEQCL